MQGRIKRGLGWAAAAGAALSLQLACVDKTGGDTGTAPLYVYDSSSNAILAWNDINTVYAVGNGGTAPAPDRTIPVETLIGTTPPGWGGMAMSGATQYLYLVANDGNNGLLIENVGSCSTTPSSANYTLFQFDSTSDGGGLSNGIFGQAATNSRGDLLVSEWNDSTTQIWKIDGSKLPNATNRTTNLIQKSFFATVVSGDKDCTGLALNGSSRLYAYFDQGTNIPSSDGNTNYAGARLRKADYSGGFSANPANVLANGGSVSTHLASFGSLAYDSANDLLYVGTETSAAPVLVFNPGSFGSNPSVAPKTILGGPNSGSTYLRVIAHAGQKDWLAGIESSTTDITSGTPSNKLWIWKAPSQGDTHVCVTLPDTDSGGAVKALAIALDGSQ